MGRGSATGCSAPARPRGPPPPAPASTRLCALLCSCQHLVQPHHFISQRAQPVQQHFHRQTSRSAGMLPSCSKMIAPGASRRSMRATICSGSVDSGVQPARAPADDRQSQGAGRAKDARIGQAHRADGTRAGPCPRPAGWPIASAPNPPAAGRLKTNLSHCCARKNGCPANVPRPRSVPPIPDAPRHFRRHKKTPPAPRPGAGSSSNAGVESRIRPVVEGQRHAPP